MLRLLVLAVVVLLAFTPPFFTAGACTAAFDRESARLEADRKLPPGPLLIAKVPVENLVCRLYRDEEIRVQLHYDERNRLTRIVTEMNPFKSLPIPLTQAVLHWGR